MNPFPNSRSYQNLYLYGSDRQKWGVTITSDEISAPISIMNTQFSAPTNASRDVIYGATLNDTDVILIYTMAASISQLRDRCFYLATAHSGANELVVQQLKIGEDFNKRGSNNFSIGDINDYFRRKKMFESKIIIANLFSYINSKVFSFRKGLALLVLKFMIFKYLEGESE
jgi:hypothetical protein